MRMLFVGAAGVVALLGCGGVYDVSGQGTAINTGVLNDHQALTAVIDAHRQQVDILSLARGRVEHSAVAYLVMKNLIAEQGELVRHQVLLATLNGDNETGAAYNQMHNLSAETYGKLADLHGQDFDRAFLREEQRLFATMLNFIDDRLNKDADSWAWQQDLQATRNSYAARITDIIDARDYLNY